MTNEPTSLNHIARFAPIVDALKDLANGHLDRCGVHLYSRGLRVADAPGSPPTAQLDIHIQCMGSDSFTTPYVAAEYGHRFHLTPAGPSGGIAQVVRWDTGDIHGPYTEMLTIRNDPHGRDAHDVSEERGWEGWAEDLISTLLADAWRYTYHLSLSQESHHAA